MDTTRDITYRSFLLNDEDIDDSIVGGGGDGSGIEGCVVDSVEFFDVDVVQWTEKRSQGDGNDAGDVFLGVRRIRMAGTLYSKTRLTLFDKLFELRAALNPVLAQREEPLDKGYRPLYFSVPTNRNADYPEGAIPLMVFALPRSIQHTMDRDREGGEDTDAGAIPWQASFVCRDPGIYGQEPVNVDFDATSSFAGTTTGSAATNVLTASAAHGLVAGDRVTFSSLTGGTGLVTGTTYYVIASGLTATDFKLSATLAGSEVNFTTDVTAATWIESTTVSGTWDNRGLYLGQLEMLVVVGAGAGTISGTIGDSVFTITVPASSGARTIRLKQIGGKILTFEEADVENPEMSAITFTGDTTWPLVDPGETPYSITFHGMAGLGAGGHMWFYEQYA